EGFAEPPWSTAGGDADIEVFAVSPTSVTGGIYGTVDHINAEPGNCYIQLTGALTGATWLRDEHHLVVLRNAADQGAAWPFAVLSAIGNKSGYDEGSNQSRQSTEWGTWTRRAQSPTPKRRHGSCCSVDTWPPTSCRT